MKTISHIDLKSKTEEILNDIKDNNTTYIVTINSIPVATIGPLTCEMFEGSIGSSYNESFIISSDED